MEEELLELIRLERKREPLSPGRRLREFQRKLQNTKIGEEAELRGFITGRKAPNAPGDALYLLLSPLPPSELAALPKGEFRTYAVLRIDDKTSFTGRVKPGSYVAVSGTVDAYPMGNLRMIRARSIEGLDYSDYWKDYREFALSQGEIRDLFEGSVYLRDEMRNVLLYSLHGVPYIPGESWGEGFEFLALRYKDESEVLALWNVLKSLHSALPREVQLRRERLIEADDPLLGLDFRFSDPNGSDIRYYTPPTKRGLVNPAKWALKALNAKRAIGFLPKNVEASPLDRMARLSETPFVLVSSEERPYFEAQREFFQLIPNLLVTIFMNRDRYSALDGRRTRPMEEEFLRWLRESRNDYGEEFRALTAPSGPMSIKLRAELGRRLFGSIVRFKGRATKRAAREVRRINDTLVNEWMVVLRDHPKEMMRLLKEYRMYIPGSLKARRALEVLNDLASISRSGEVSKEAFIRELLREGFSERSALEVVEKFIATGYVYEPFPGRLKIIGW
ncbi:hypothetical protein [Thermococcus sp.]|uniref:hypothetical protein n=1 Tax=Thermococcus sp. TaxID=35749 RepID=UPI00262DF88E|nr:hypothetical protein [Thermococcus sp.]